MQSLHWIEFQQTVSQTVSTNVESTRSALLLTSRSTLEFVLYSTDTLRPALMPWRLQVLSAWGVPVHVAVGSVAVQPPDDKTSIYVMKAIRETSCGQSLVTFPLYTIVMQVIAAE